MTNQVVTNVKKGHKKSGRERAREFALQALYQWIVNRSDLSDIDLYTRDLAGFNKCDLAHYEKILEQTVMQQADLMQAIEPLLDRGLTTLSPIEHASILLGAFELKNCLDVPYRVVINEYVEIAKSFGGSDGFRYVNGVLHQLAKQWRSIEIAAES